MKNTTKHTTICVGHHSAQTNTNNVNNSWILLQTTALDIYVFISQEWRDMWTNVIMWLVCLMSQQ